MLIQVYTRHRHVSTRINICKNLTRCVLCRIAGCFVLGDDLARRRSSATRPGALRSTTNRLPLASSRRSRYAPARAERVTSPIAKSLGRAHTFVFLQSLLSALTCFSKSDTAVGPGKRRIETLYPPTVVVNRPRISPEASENRNIPSESASHRSYRGR